MPRDNILLRKLPKPKPVRLPNGRTFYAKYGQVSRRELPQNVRVRRTYRRTIGPRHFVSTAYKNLKNKLFRKKKETLDSSCSGLRTRRRTL